MPLVENALRHARGDELEKLKIGMGRVLEHVAHLNQCPDTHVLKLEVSNVWIPTAPGVQATITISVCCPLGNSSVNPGTLASPLPPVG